MEYIYKKSSVNTQTHQFLTPKLQPFVDYSGHSQYSLLQRNNINQLNAHPLMVEAIKTK